MYDLSVEEAHTFAVGEGDWVVHNVDCHQAAIDAANRHRIESGQNTSNPEGVSAAIVDSDGDVRASGHSGNTGDGSDLHPDLLDVLPTTSQRDDGVDAHVCAEVDACDNLLAEIQWDFEGDVNLMGHLGPFTIAAVRNGTGEIVPPCPNCATWVYVVFGEVVRK